MKKQSEELLKRVFELISKAGIEHDEDAPIRKNLTPYQISRSMDLGIGKEGIDISELMDSLDVVVENSVNTNAPLFLTQMYGGVQLSALIGDIVTSFLNTSMYTYEVAPMLTMIEKQCIGQLCKYVWKDSSYGDGIFTPGGSISNIEAMVLARNAKFPAVHLEGSVNLPKFSCFVSDQAHYSFLKGGRFLGFGEQSIIEVESDRKGKICLSSLKSSIEQEVEKGHVPLMLVGVAGTTATGVYDDLESLAQIAQSYDMWFHVDAVYGGSLLFSDDHAGKLSGIHHADSVSWNLHKIMGIPLVCAAFLTREKGVLNNTFSTSADYLFHYGENDYDLGQKSLQCGRRVDALKLWLAWKFQGKNGFIDRVNTLVAKAGELAARMNKDTDIELFCEPESPIVCFRFISNQLSESELDSLNASIRTKLFEKGQILFNYTNIGERTYLRCVITNPEMSTQDIEFLVNEIKTCGRELLANAVSSPIEHPSV